MYMAYGRDMRLEDIENIFQDLEEITKTGNVGNFVRYSGLENRRYRWLH